MKIKCTRGILVDTTIRGIGLMLLRIIFWVTGITEIPTEITKITMEITEITMEITEITIKGWGGGRYDRLGWIRIG